MNKMIKKQKNLLYARLILFSVVLMLIIFVTIIFKSEIDKELFYIFVFCGILYIGLIVHTIYKINQPVSKLIDEQKSIINGQINRYKKIIEDLEKELNKYDEI